MSCDNIEVVDSENLATDAVPKAPRANPEEGESCNNFKQQKKNKKYSKRQSGSEKGPQKTTNNLYIDRSIVHFGPAFYNCNSSPGTDPTKLKKKTKTGISFGKLLNDNSEVTGDDLTFVSKNIFKSWREMGRLLGYTDEQMDQFEYNKRFYNIDEAILALLSDWKHVNTSEATVGKLASILLQCGDEDVLSLWRKQRKERNK